MNVQSVLLQLDSWHEFAKPQHLSESEYIELYKGLVREEWKEFQDAEAIGNIVKEACDVIVVCWPLITKGTSHQNKLHLAMINCVESVLHEMNINWPQALAKVNESNFSKLILAGEVDEASDYFAHQGIDVRIESVGDAYFAAYSTHDQTVNGKFYKAEKLLKPQSYFEVDELTEWWL